MQNGDNIEKLFKDSFQNFEADVNPNIWTNVQNGISSSAGSTAGTAAKFALGKIIAGVAAVGIVGAGILYVISNNENKTNAVSENKKNKTEVVSTEPPKNILAENKPEQTTSNSSAHKQTTSTHHSEKTHTSSQQPEVVSTVSSNNQTADNTSTDNSAPVQHKYGNASQDDGGMMRYNRNANENNVLATDNSSSDENTSADEISADGDAAATDDQERTSETKPAPTIDNIPNIFTPNGDGENDIFFFPMKNIASVGVAILNRNGDLVAKWNTLDGSWNGKTFSGMDAQAGVYYYSIQAIGTDGSSIYKKGTITIER